MDDVFNAVKPKCNLQDLTEVRKPDCHNQKANSFALYCTMSQHWKLLKLLLDVFTHSPNKTEHFFVVFFQSFQEKKIFIWEILLRKNGLEQYAGLFVCAVAEDVAL